jgi:hypothetical protein
VALPTDQKVGGSSPFERATQTGLVGIPARPVVVWGQMPRSPRAASTPGVPDLGRFGPNLYPNPDPAVEPLKTPNALHFKEVDGVYPTSFVGDLHPVHPLDAFGRPEPCQNGLVEDHSGGYRIEPLRPSGVLVDYRPGEVRPGEVR